MKSAAKSKHRKVAISPAGSAHERAIKELREGPVITADTQQWLISILDNWIQRGSPCVDTDQSLTPNTTIEPGLDLDLSARREAGEHAWAHYKDTTVKHSVAITDAIAWLKKTHPATPASRTNVTEEYSKWKLSVEPHRPWESFEGNETAEQAAKYGAEHDAYISGFFEEVDVLTPDDRHQQHLRQVLHVLEWNAFLHGERIAAHVSERISDLIAKGVVSLYRRAVPTELLGEDGETFAPLMIHGLLLKLNKRLGQEVEVKIQAIVKSESGPNSRPEI